jgi:hypothetical protein
VLDAVDLARQVLIMRPVPAQRFQIRRTKETPISQHSVERFDGVAFTLDVPVVVGMVKAFWSNIQDVIVQHIEDIDARKASTCMPGVCVLDDTEDRPPVFD